MNEIIIVLPLPSPKLSPNAGLSSLRKSSQTKKHKRWAKQAAIAALNLRPPPLWNRAEIKAVWFRATTRKIDQGNACNWLKAYEDGFEAAKIYIDDRDVEWAKHEFKKAKRKGSKLDKRIELTIRSLDAGETQ